MDRPKRTGKPPEEVTLTGKVLPWAQGQPVLLEMPFSIWRYLPLFESPDALKSFMSEAGIEWESIKQVDADHDFLSSFQGTDVKVILNPWYTEQRRVRFHEVLGWP